MYDIHENEHQELFYANTDLTRSLPIHIPSPLGRLQYYVYVRMPAPRAKHVEHITLKVDVGGLIDEHWRLAWGQDVDVAHSLPSVVDGLVWLCAARMDVSRGNGHLDFLDAPDDIGRGDVLITTWPRFVESGQADEWLACQSDPNWAPSGVPLGGIGCGRVDICRDGRFRNFSANNNQDAPLENAAGLPGAYLALSIGDTVRELATTPIVDGHECAPHLSFEARFPQATLRDDGIFDGIDACATLSGPLAPQNLTRSSLPGFLVRWTVRNSGSGTAEVACRMGWPNLVGIGGNVSKVETSTGQGDGKYHHWDDPAGREESLIIGDGYLAVEYSGTPADDHVASSGTHILAVADPDGGADASFGGGHGEVVASVVVPPGEERSVTMAVVAAMPTWVDSLREQRPVYWTNSYGDAQAIVEELLSSADEILLDAGALASHLDDSTLPAWLTARLSNCLYPLVTNSVLYADGRYSINEGPTEMVGCYGTIDQRLGAHPAAQLFFPILNKSELEQFAAKQAPNGGICHDLGHGHLEGKPIDTHWPDLTCSFIIQTARHAWSTGDKAFDDAMYPRAIRALARHGVWADAGGGVAQLGQDSERLGTSYDSYHYYGTNAYIATLWLAALNVCEEWTRRRGESPHADIPRWRVAAIRKLDADLWNGHFYIAYRDQTGRHRTTCHAGQLAGQVFSQMLVGADVVSREKVDTIVDSLFALNGHDRFAVPPDEVEPTGAVGSDFCWLPYVEAFMLTAAATIGDARLWHTWERMILAADGARLATVDPHQGHVPPTFGRPDTDDDGAQGEVLELASNTTPFRLADGVPPVVTGPKHPCDTRLMYIPATGMQAWGTYYMTAPASWLVYDAWLGFFFDAANGTLRLQILPDGRYPIVHPLFWATADMRDGHITLTVTRVFGDPPILRRVNGAAHALTEPVALCEGAVVQWRE